MALSTITGGAPAPQLDRGLLALLHGLDETEAASLLKSSEGSSSRLPSPFTGLLLSLQYDPAEVLDLVDELWPERVFGHHGFGQKPKDPLPVVCFLLPRCDPDHGTVFNLSEAYRRLKSDGEFRSLCGYAERIPSYSVFRNIASKMSKNWDRFQLCLLSPDELKKLLAKIASDEVGLSTDCGVDLNPGTFAAELCELGWNGNLPPRYRDNRETSQMLQPFRVVGRLRGRACNSNAEPDGKEGRVPLSEEGEMTAGSCRRYPRDWRAYNGAQVSEVTEVKALLGGLADLINLMECRFQGPRGRGRPRFPLGHAVFAVVLKVFSGLSSRRFESVLAESVKLGYLRSLPACVLSSGAGVDGEVPSGLVRIPQFNTVSDILRSQWMTPLLLELVSVMASPLRDVETVFAVDGTGLSTRIYERWINCKPVTKPGDDAEAESGAQVEVEAEDNAEAERKGWVKLHAVAGVKTQVFVRVATSPSSDHDSPYFRGLVSEAVSRFDVQKVAADLAYSSRGNHDLGEELGFIPLIPYKVNTLPPSNDGSAWSKDLKHFLDHPEDFWLAYHQRSNVESAFSSGKRIMPEQLRTKHFYTQVNESLCKVIAHNLRVVAREVRVRRIELDLPTEVLALEDCIKEVIKMRRSQPLEQPG